MVNSSARMCLASALLLASLASPLFAGSGRVSSVDKFGIGGYIQPIGLHHGFHIERIASGSSAEKDKLRAHDVIVKVDGEPIRSLDHLRALLAEAYADGGDVTITYMRAGSLAHHDLLCNLKPAPAKVARKPKPSEKVTRKPKAADPDDSDDVEIR